MTKRDSTDKSGAMVFPDKDWVESVPESQGVDSKKMHAAIEVIEKAFEGAGGIMESLIVRNGRVIWKGSQIDRKHIIWSASKSFTSTVLGILIDDGKVTLDTLAKEYVPNLAALYPNVTLRHFATMTSGYDGEGGGYGENDPLDGSNTPLIPTTPLFEPGTKFGYFDDAMREFGYVLTRILGEPLDAFFKRRVADPIGMNPDAWDWSTRSPFDGYDIEVRDSAGGINITARELAKFGHLFLNGGNWAGKQIVSASWVKQVGTPQVPIDIGHNDISVRQRNIDGRGLYSYNWWVNGVGISGKRRWASAPKTMFAACGLNENKCFVIPDWNTVVVRIGTAGKIRNSDEVWSEFFAKLSGAIVA